jgi:hypothetical protein
VGHGVSSSKEALLRSRFSLVVQGRDVSIRLSDVELAGEVSRSDQPHLVLNHHEHDAPIAVVGPQDGEVFGLLDPNEGLLFP